MKATLLAATALLGLALAPANAAFVSTVTSTRAGLSTTCDVSSPAGAIAASCAGGGFADVSITATAPPLLAPGDISATTLTVTSLLGGGTTLHANFLASGFNFTGGNVEAVLTINNLIGGDAGPFVLSAITPSGTETHTFTGTGSIDVGPIAMGAFTTDQADFALTFSAAGQSVDATIEIIAAPVPEPGSMAILGGGVLGLGMLARRRRTV